MKILGLVEIKCHHLPTLTAVSFISTFLVSYTVAVSLKHVYPILPYISDTGAIRPESSFFGFFLCISSILMLTTVYIRHNYIKLAIESNEIQLSNKLNSKASICGVLACFGLFIVANFQETTIFALHFAGALCAFILGTLYFILQTKISFPFKLAKIISKTTFYLRFLLSGCMPILFLSCLILAKFGEDFLSGGSVVWYTPKMKSYPVHIASTAAEWLTTIAMIIYLITFTCEFKTIQLDEIKFSKTI